MTAEPTIPYKTVDDDGVVIAEGRMTISELAQAKSKINRQEIPDGELPFIRAGWYAGRHIRRTFEEWEAGFLYESTDYKEAVIWSRIAAALERAEQCIICRKLGSESLACMFATISMGGEGFPIPACLYRHWEKTGPAAIADLVKRRGGAS
jgi:hypothetical protein